MTSPVRLRTSTPRSAVLLLLVVAAVAVVAVTWLATREPEWKSAKCTVSVQVVGSEDARPLSGAAVRLLVEDVEVAATTTDAAGRAEFRDVRAERYVFVVAEATGRSPVKMYAATLMGVCGPPRAVLTQAVRAELPESGSVTGRVIGPDGTPFEGAQVTSYARRSKLHWILRTRVRSAADGTFRLDGVPLGEEVEIQCGPLGRTKAPLTCFEAPVWAPAMPRPAVTLSHEHPEAQVELRLRDVATLALTILGPDGERVTAGEVDLTAREHQIAPRLPFAAGAFRRTYEPGRYVLDVTADGYRSAPSRAIDLPAGGTLTTEVRLTK